MKIGIDIDNTLTQTTKIFLKYLNKYKTKHNIKDKQLCKRDYYDFLNTYGEIIFKNVKLKQFAKSIISSWYNKGHKIYFVTARNNGELHNLEKYTLDYLNMHCIKYDDIFFVRDSKSDTVKHLNLNVFIDDKETVLDEFAKNNILLIRMTNNRNEQSKYIKVKNWKQIDRIIKKEEEK